MTRDSVREMIARNLADVLDEDHIDLTDQTRADEVDGWDSVNHVKLIIAIESEMGIRFESDEITSPENVGALIDLIMSKKAA
ncbi:MAG TPA: acyl carrier protein [Rhodoblastus sp.]|nr:acyl carrier protein [Rhodoblastus sp.]